MKTSIDAFLIHPDATLRDAARVIDKAGEGIALVVNEQKRLAATITDGDMRRAILAGMTLDDPVSRILAQRAASARPTPLTASVGTPPAELLHLMTQHVLRHIPLLDSDGRVQDLALLSRLVGEYEPKLDAVIMAGGFGTRLRPLTEHLPKPMLPVGDRPLLEWTIERLREAGIHDLNITTHYKGDKIREHFGDGERHGVHIRYVAEDRPLGTAGALGLLDGPPGPLLVINGDVLTRVDFRAMLAYHREHKADMTVAVKLHEFRIPYGTVESEGDFVRSIREKPVVRHFINAGIYLLNPDVRRMVPEGERSDMPDLIQRLLAEGRRVASFPIHEYWMDIGQIEQYEKANADVERGDVE